MRKRIAIIGTGISGLTCGYLLHREHEITVFEANDYIGGHTATKDVDVEGKQYAIDTGFIVFNDWTYPHFIRLMDALGVERQPTEMSFSVKNPSENLEYNGNNLNTLFAQRRNLLRPKFYRIVRDILRFNRLCKQIHQSNDGGEINGQTLGAFLQTHNFCEDFSHNYILPMCAAIWSATLNDIKGFPLTFFLQFFNNHGLLNINDRPQWYTIVGGSKQYISPLTQGFSQHIRLSTPVVSVARVGQTIVVKTANGDKHLFDDVIFACHSDQALKMLSKPTTQQQDILSSIPYKDNEVVLHTDDAVLPQRKLAWASWNYHLNGAKDEYDAPTTLTYNMNILQRIQSDTTFCVTLNNSKDIDPDKILGQFHYAHPQFSTQTIHAQNRRDEICGVDGIHFCGAYWYNGFHEDGVRSALDVCHRFGQSLDRTLSADVPGTGVSQ